jgi:formate hydrogenlyase transcriptional activator
MKKKLNILGELMAQLQGTKSREVLVRRLASFMYENFKSAAVEITWNIGASIKVYSVTRKGEGYQLRITDRDINQSAFSEVLASGQALVSEVQDEVDDNLFIEERIAVELFASQLLILPLYKADDINGFINLFLLEEQDLGALSELLQHILTTITLMLDHTETVEKLTALSRRGFKKARQMHENLEDLTWKGESEAVGDLRQQLLRDCRLAAQCGTTVYLEGEEGTDKEEVAQIIHRNRTFNREVFLVFDCAKVPEASQSELLFGSLSNGRANGYYDRAKKGTLLINNIEAMVPEAQEILSDIIENGKEQAPQIILCGNIHKAVNDGDFDNELADMATELTIEVPSLRVCREDIPSICKRYLKELSGKLLLPMPKMDRKFTQAVLSAQWKGNHQELRSFLEKALICSPDKDLVIPQGFAEEGGITAIRTADSLDESIKRNIVDALRRTRGKVYGDDGAAVLLGLNPSTLQSKIRKMGIKKKSYKKI